MSKSPHPTRRALVLGGGVIALGALCALLFHGKAQPPAAPARQSQAAATTTIAVHANANRGAAKGDGAGDAEEEDADEADAPESRREQYTAAFDRKMNRVRERIARDCAGNEVLVHAADGIGEVRDRIIESAVATDRGLKTKAEQMAYERTQLEAFDAQVCRAIANESPSKQCKRHFRVCEHAVL